MTTLPIILTGCFTAATGATGKHIVRYELQRGAMNQIMQKT
ncbi:hypothetical protein [Paenibacillus durus]|nr:hypothetical protein [Paenibacillus durus]